MKRYWLFGGQTYYPGGGMRDFQGSYPDIETALSHTEKSRHWSTGRYTYEGQTQIPLPDAWVEEDMDWWHLWDSQENKIVAFSDPDRIAELITHVRNLDNKAPQT